MKGTKDMKKSNFEGSRMKCVACQWVLSGASRRSEGAVEAVFRSALSLVAAIALAGCPGGGDEEPANADPPTRVGAVELAIGATEGADEVIFSRISGLTADRRGRIYVADLESHEVRVFGPDGRLAYRIGRKGQGPGELQEPCCIALQDGDSTLWIRDGGNARYVAFTLGDTSAAYRTMIRLAHRDVNRWAPLTFDADHHLIDVGSHPSSKPGESVLVRFHLDTAGHVIREDTVPRAPNDSVPQHTVNRKLPGGGVAIMYLWPMFGPAELNAHSPNGERARAISSRYSVAWYGPDGRIIRTLERPREGPPLSAAERERAEKDIEGYMKRLSLPRGDIPFGIADRKQPLRDLYFDQEGRLWVELSVADGEAPTAHVYSPDGTLRFTAQWTPRTNLSNGVARGDVAYGVQRDSLDTERVVRLRFR